MNKTNLFFVSLFFLTSAIILQIYSPKDAAAQSPTVQASPTPIRAPGDTNGDGNINLTDLATLLSNFGKSGLSWTEGDFNGDQIISLADLTVVLANFGQTVSPSPTPTSPTIPTQTPTPTNTPTTVPTTTPAPVTNAVFSIGKGFTDVIPRQIVRANNDKVYVFVNSIPTSGTTLQVYKTSQSGLPTSTSSFVAGQNLSAGSAIISVDAVYDGQNTIHVLVNLSNGELRDYPFSILTETFKTPLSVATGLPTPSTEIGTSGISGMFDAQNTLHIAHWASGNQIIYRAYTYNNSANSLSLTSGPTRLDTNGNSNHPAVAISPTDNSVSVAWVEGSQDADNGKILIRTKASSSWQTAQQVNTVTAWTSPNSGINIDQGPSLLIDQNGYRHMVYIEDWRVSAPYDYGRIRYVTNQSGTYTDTYIGAYSHDPAIVIRGNGDIYVIGHGHPLNTSCLSMDDMCTIKKNANGTWANPQLFVAASGSQGYDASPSVKWGVVGWNRPEAIEFLFFRTDNGYADTSVMYGRF